MKSFIGGLFKNRESAEKASKALRARGLDDGSINMLQCTREKKGVMVNNPSIKSIAMGALTGALILGGVGGVLGLLVGLNVIHIPSLGPASAVALPFQITWQYIVTSVVTGLLFGGVTGAILGTATRLAMAPYRKVDTSPANKGDLLLAVQANDAARVNQVKSTMEENGAVDFEEFYEKWDPEVWSVVDEKSPQAQ